MARALACRRPKCRRTNEIKQNDAEANASPLRPPLLVAASRRAAAAAMWLAISGRRLAALAALFVVRVGVLSASFGHLSKAGQSGVLQRASAFSASCRKHMQRHPSTLSRRRNLLVAFERTRGEWRRLVRLTKFVFTHDLQLKCRHNDGKCERTPCAAVSQFLRRASRVKSYGQFAGDATLHALRRSLARRAAHILHVRARRH